MYPQVSLSLLDRSRARAGEPDAAALRHTVQRAQRAERLGYHRFWVTKHHAVSGIAGGSPAVLMAAVAARYLDGTAPVTARPRLDRPLPVFVLAAGRGLAVAGDAGLPVVLGGPVLGSDGIADIFDDYRARARAAGGTPYVVVSLDAGRRATAALKHTCPARWGAPGGTGVRDRRSYYR